jgi:hypothetical protein
MMDRDDEAWRAETALHCTFLDETLLHVGKF